MKPNPRTQNIITRPAQFLFKVQGQNLINVYTVDTMLHLKRKGLQGPISDPRRYLFGMSGKGFFQD